MSPVGWDDSFPCEECGFDPCRCAPTKPAQAAGNPIRLRLSRAKGFNLQALSQTANGLPAVNVARPSKWGNPFVIESMPRLGGTTKWRRGEERKRRFQVVEMFRGMLVKGEGEPWERMKRELDELRGKNLACWCAEGEKLCHAQVLLELANTEPTT